MVLDDNLGVGKQIVLQLLGIQKPVVHVLPGRRYKRVRRNQYTIVPAAMEDYRALGRSVLKKEQAPSRIIDLWPLRRGDASQPLDEDLGLLYLLKELDKYHAPNIEIAVVSSTTHSIEGSFPTVVEHLRRSIAAEFSQVVLRNINVNFLGRSPEQIAVEILTNLGSPRVSYPDNKRPIGKIHISHEDQPARNQAEVTDGQLSVVPNELESALVVWWRELLSIDDVTLDEDFFDLGGDSITAARLFKKIQKRYNIEIGLSAIFEARTISRLANLIRQEIAKAPSALRSGRSIVALQPIGTRTPIYVISGLGGNVIKFYPLASHLGEDQPMFGLLPRGLDGREPYFTRIEDMAAYYADAVQRVQSEGPYRLMGYSFGGLVALEVAQQIRARGGEISFLGLLDTSEPVYMEKFQKTLPARERYRAYRDHLRQFASVGHMAGRFKNLLIRKLSSLTYRLFGAFDRGVPRELAKLEYINASAAARYRPTFYPGTLTLFRSAERQISEGNDKSLGWEGRVSRLDVIDIPSNHFNILNEPAVSALAEKLKFCLGNDLAKARPSSPNA
jgi:aspartate racemase